MRMNSHQDVQATFYLKLRIVQGGHVLLIVSYVHVSPCRFLIFLVIAPDVSLFWFFRLFFFRSTSRAVAR